MQKVAFFLIVVVIFSFGAVLTGCGSIPPAELLEASNNTAKVYFIMPSGVTVTGFGSLSVGNKFNLWNGDNFLSAIGGSQYLVFNFNAGSHLILAKGNDFNVASADLVAGKSYYIKVIILPGFSSPHVTLALMDPNDPDLEKYLEKECKEIAPQGKVSESMVAEAAKVVSEVRSNTRKIDLVIK